MSITILGWFAAAAGLIVFTVLLVALLFFLVRMLIQAQSSGYLTAINEQSKVLCARLDGLSMQMWSLQHGPPRPSMLGHGSYGPGDPTPFREGC